MILRNDTISRTYNTGQKNPTLINTLIPKPAGGKNNLFYFNERGYVSVILNLLNISKNDLFSTKSTILFTNHGIGSIF